MSPLPLQRHVPGVASAEIRHIDGRAVVWADIDPSVRRGALSSEASGVIAAAAELAHGDGHPIVVVMSSSGADITEGVGALHGWGRAARALAACSGRVPTVFIVDGPAVSGPALLVGMADLVIMTEQAFAFMSGPSMVADFTGVQIDTDELGGAATHARYTGLACHVVSDRTEAEAMVGHLLAYLPDSTDLLPPRWPTDDTDHRSTPEAGAVVPSSSSGSYDVRDIIRSLADDGEMTELRARWAPNIVTVLATFAGRPTGVVANQPLALAGTLDIPASQKAARFVAFCDAFNLPLLTLVDTPGFYPGKDLEWRGMIRHGAQLVFAYARATVPRVSVILRKSYGGAYIVMDSKRMGNDVCLAWPWAELAVMGAGQAAAILQRRASVQERASFEADYAERLLNPYVAAERGLIDAVIEPADTRRLIIEAFHLLADKREALTPSKHDNMPL